MKQLLQDMKTGKTQVVDIPVPQVGEKSALVRTATSLVSAGTERMLVEFAKQGLIGKAQSRPDLVQQVLNKAKREGLLSTLDAARNKLGQPLTLGYSSAGTIVETGSNLSGFRAGDRVACGGGGYAVHAEFANIPQNLLVRIPDSVDFEQAAFATIGAVAMQGFRLADVQVGANVAVIGLGLLGLLATGIASAAGCRVLTGELRRNASVHVMRAGTEIVKTEISSIRREKDDVREVREGMECGIKLSGFNDIKQNDVLEAYKIEEVARTL